MNPTPAGQHRTHGCALTIPTKTPLLQAVASAHKALSSALAGVTLSGDEQEVLARRLKAAADKKLGDLLQVRRVGLFG